MEFTINKEAIINLRVTRRIGEVHGRKETRKERREKERKSKGVKEA